MILKPKQLLGVLPTTMLPLMLTGSLLKRPPPLEEAELLAKVLLLIFIVRLFSRPPRRPQPMVNRVAKLLAKVLLLMLTVPLFSRPPPLQPVEPWAMVRALSVKVTPLFTNSTCTLLLPSRVTLWPLPSRVRFWLITSVEPRVIVPLQPNLMVS